MDYEQLNKYNNIVDETINTLYAVANIIVNNLDFEYSAIKSLIDMDILAYLLYLGDKDGKLSDAGIEYIKSHTKIDIPEEYWYKMLSDLKYDINTAQIPKTFDLFIEWDNNLIKQGEERLIAGEAYIMAFQTLGLGFVGADLVINKNEKDRVVEVIDKMKEYYNEKLLIYNELDLPTITDDLIRKISYSTDAIENTNTDTNESEQPLCEIKFLKVKFMDKHYSVPEDATVLLQCREFVGNEIVKLIKVASGMVERYANDGADYFFEHFDSEIKLYHDTMLEACHDIVDNLISREIYDVSVDDFAAKLSSFHAVEELGVNAVRKVTSEVKKLVDARNVGMEAAYKAAASNITGSGLRIFTSSFTSLMVYSAVEKQIMLSQAKKADQQYEKAINKITAASTDAYNQICTSVLVNDFGYGLIEIIEQFNNELQSYYLLELALHGQFSTDSISNYSENRSNAILENIEKVADKKRLLENAYEICPFNIDVYEKWLELGSFDVDTLIDAKKIFPVDKLLAMVELVIDKNLNKIEGRIDDYVTVLADYKHKSREQIIKQYFSKAGHKIIEKFKNINEVCSDMEKFDAWVRNNISSKIENIAGYTEAEANSKIAKWMERTIEDEKYNKLNAAGIISLEDIKMANSQQNTYYGVKKEYRDLLFTTFMQYVNEAKRREKIYKEAYEKYNITINDLETMINNIKQLLECLGFFEFSRKKELNNKLVDLKYQLIEAKRNEPTELKDNYYNMYRR